ncbi:FecR domain-containing protein [Gemmatimonas sp.]|uniref:FecR family protein n=1 Tax=Gemmatimonas sp. TaxID=1962908 RepID=UPI00333FA5DF
MIDHAPNEPDDPFDLRQSAVDWQRRELEPLLSAADGQQPPFDAEAAWKRMSPRLAARRVQRSSGRRAFVLAAVSAAAVLIVAVLNQTKRTPSSMVVATAIGEVDSTTLSDGTVVVLDGGTRVETDDAFGDRARDIRLQGRAHFRVAHDAARPFRVFAGGMVAEALGTAFTVADDPLRDEVEVVVTDGRVAFALRGSDAAPVVLHAGDRALRRAGTTVVERRPPSEEDTAWMSGDRRVAALPLRRVLPRMNQWFGLSVLVADSVLLERRLTVDWRHTSASRALSELAAIIDAEVVQRGDTITLHARGDGGRHGR